MRYSRSGLFAIIALAACRPKPIAQREEGGSPAPVASLAVDAAPPVEPEKLLTWGTRPSEKGPLFPLVDGLCVHAEVRPTKGKVLYTQGSRTFARIEDEGIVHDPVLEGSAPDEDAGVGGPGDPALVSGTWPSLVMMTHDNGGGRMRSFESIWVLTEKGWSNRGSWAEPGEPGYAAPVVFKDWIVTFRTPIGPEFHGDGPWGPPVVRTWPLASGATPIPGIASLARAKFIRPYVEVAGESVYAFGEEDAGGSERHPVVRVLKDGKVMEGRAPEGWITSVVGRKGDSLFVLVSHEAKSTVHRFDGAASTALPFKVAKEVNITGSGIAPNGAVWILTENQEVMVLREDKVTTTKLPSPEVALPRETGTHRATGGRLAGVEFGDPYAIGENGALFHFENEEWHEVEMPPSPFATGKYQAQSIVMPAQGDLFVNAGYPEKGPGWKTPQRYRAILRTKRPKEVLRCNEPPGAEEGASGYGFSSSPPRADDACATPFVVVIRLGTKKNPLFLYDTEGKLPTLRTAMKETPGLGATAEMVEIPWAGVRAVGVKAPDMATARAFALNAAKHVKNQYIETRPEIVCGTPPTIEKTTRVDIATGRVIAPDAN